MQVRSLGCVEEELAAHSSIPAWNLIEEPGGPQSMGSQSWTQLSMGHSTNAHAHAAHTFQSPCSFDSWDHLLGKLFRPAFGKLG